MIKEKLQAFSWHHSADKEKKGMFSFTIRHTKIGPTKRASGHGGGGGGEPPESPSCSSYGPEFILIFILEC